MHCSKCKAEIDDYDGTCPFCGQKTSELYVRDVSELRRKIKENTPPIKIDFSNIIKDIIKAVFYDKYNEFIGLRLALVFFVACLIGIFVIIFGIFKPDTLLAVTNCWDRLFDSFWLLFGLKPTNSRGDIRNTLTMLMLLSFILKFWNKPKKEE